MVGGGQRNYFLQCAVLTNWVWGCILWRMSFSRFAMEHGNVSVLLSMCVFSTVGSHIRGHVLVDVGHLIVLLM